MVSERALFLFLIVGFQGIRGLFWEMVTLSYLIYDWGSVISGGEVLVLMVGGIPVGAIL